MTELCPWCDTICPHGIDQIERIKAVLDKQDLDDPLAAIRKIVEE